MGFMSMRYLSKVVFKYLSKKVLKSAIISSLWGVLLSLNIILVDQNIYALFPLLLNYIYLVFF